MLERCWDSIDFLSAHRYSRNDHDDTPSFLAEGVVVDAIIDDYRSLLRVVQSRKKSNHAVRLSFDEWNVWYKEMTMSGGWTRAPHLIEEVYNLEDALVCAQYLHSFIRNADVVKVACLAQLVNVIAPLLTTTDDLLVQSIYWPFQMLSSATAGDSLRAAVDAPTVATTRRGEVAGLDVAATVDDGTGTGMVSLVNRHTETALDVTVELAGLPGTEAQARLLHHPDPKAHNSWDDRDVIDPTRTEVDFTDGTLSLRLPELSHAVVRIR